ncbi:MAG: trigger factor [Myxococcales bacterium]|nr:trigger factor [Myxococcales bacterium]
MQVTLEKLSPVLVELRVEVPADTVSTEVDSAYTSLQRRARVRGFRPGKAPRAILKQVYADAVHADVAKRLVDRMLEQAMADKAVQPLTQPDVHPSELDPGQAFSFKARFEVRPEIESVTWEGLEASRPAIEVTGAQIDAEIEKLRLEHATLEPPAEPRAAKKGDIVAVALAFQVPGGKPITEELETEIGARHILPEIDQALEGTEIGATKETEASFPTGHQRKDLRGKKATFKITVKEIKERILPKVDDEFAKDCGDYADLAALREGVAARLKKQAEQRTEEDVARQLVNALCAKNPIPVPPSLVEQQARVTERELVMAAQAQGGRYNPTAELRERVLADSEMKVRAGLLMAEIAKAKSIQVTPEDIEKGYQELAEQSGKNVAKIKAEYRDPNKQQMLIGMILEDKILDLLESSGKITAA